MKQVSGKEAGARCSTFVRYDNLVLLEMLERHTGMSRSALINKCIQESVSVLLSRNGISKPDGLPTTRTQYTEFREANPIPDPSFRIGHKFKGFTIVSKKPTQSHNGRSYKYTCECDTCSRTKVRTEWQVRNNKARCGCYGVINSFRRGAESRGIPFDLEDKAAWLLLRQQEFKCALTGQDIYVRSNGDRTASIDRIDSARGYCIDNIQWVHKSVNKLKMAHNQQSFISMCKKVGEHADN